MLSASFMRRLLAFDSFYRFFYYSSISLLRFSYKAIDFRIS